jgi:hypothetical protein
MEGGFKSEGKQNGMGKKITDPNASFNIGNSEFFSNLNPVTR